MLIANFQEGDGAHLGKDAEPIGLGNGVKIGRFKFGWETFTEEAKANDAVEDALGSVRATQE